MADKKSPSESRTRKRSTPARPASLPPLPDGPAPWGSVGAPTTSVLGSVVPAGAPPAAQPLVEFLHDAGRDGLVADTELGRPTPSDSSSQDERVLLFNVGDEEYGVSIMHIREILKPPLLTEVPRAPSHVMGVFSLRGTVLPVIGLTAPLGLPSRQPAHPEEARVLVVGKGEDAVGLHVHRVDQVVKMSLSTLEPAPRGLSTQRRALLRGLGKHQDRLIIMLNLPALLAELGLGTRPEAEET